VLCEKPLTLDERSAARVIAAARRQGVFLMEAFMYRCHPLLRELLARLRDGVIGPIRHVRADFGFRAPGLPGTGCSVRRSAAAASSTSAATRLLRASDRGRGGGRAVRRAGRPHRQRPDRADRRRRAGERAPDVRVGFTASVSLRGVVRDRHVGRRVRRARQDRAAQSVDSERPPPGARDGFTIYRDGCEPETVTIRTDKPTYAIEAEYVAHALPAIEPEWPAMSWADTLGNLRVMDAWTASLRAQAQL
jgi:predicted dehydrogenase